MMAYLDTSTVLRVVLRDGVPLRAWGTWQSAFASELLGLEARRAIDRLRLLGALDDAGVVAAIASLARIERGLHQVVLNRAVLRRAAMPMGTVVKTLDALHLASAVLLRERQGVDLTFATHDAQQAAAAAALGFACIGA